MEHTLSIRPCPNTVQKWSAFEEDYLKSHSLADQSIMILIDHENSVLNCQIEANQESMNAVIETF